jgi:putative DNA primase/helicase
VIFNKKHQILQQIKKAIGEGKRVVACTNMLDTSYEIANLVRSTFPEKKVLLYNSKSDSRSKTFDLSKPNDRMLADALIYSPTITAGVSIEIDHYDEIFCIFTSQSSNADVCAQMIGRVRSLRLNRVSIFCDYGLN